MAFPAMRRARQALSREDCETILKRRQTAVLALQGCDGYPYAVPVNYVYAEGKVYFHGAKVGHKQDAIARCDKVSLCVIDRDEVDAATLATDYRSVILFGRARVLDGGEECVHAARLLGLKFNPDAAFVDSEIARTLPALRCVEIRVEHMSGKESLLRGRQKS